MAYFPRQHHWCMRLSAHVCRLRRLKVARGLHTDAGVPKVIGDFLKMWEFTRRLVLRRVDTLIVDEVSTPKVAITA